VAVKSEGNPELVSRLNQHWSWLSDTGELKHRRLARAREELTALAFAALRGGWPRAGSTSWPGRSPTAPWTRSRPPMNCSISE